MSLQFIVLCAALAIARAGYLAPAAPAVSYSTYAAAPAVRYAAPAVSYAAPAVSYAAPAVSYATPAVAAAPVVQTTYHGNGFGYAAAPAAVGYGAAYGYGAGYGYRGYAAPAVSYAAPAVHAAPALAYGAAPVAATAVVGQQSNILRRFGNLGTVSTYSKTLDTPFASVRKSDVRVSNPGYRLAAPVAAYAAAPAVAAAPVVHTSYHGNGFGYPAAPAAVGYGAAYGYGAGYGHRGYAAAAPVAYGHAGYAGVGYAGYTGGYGLGYHAAPAVAHVSYTGNVGSYAW